MLTDITLGQYFPGNSIVHKLDPRVKIILIAVLIVMLFVTNTLIAYLLLAGFILLTVYLSKLSFRMILRGLKPVLVIILITGILNLFYTPGVEVLRLFGVLSITREGIFTAILMVTRLILLIAGTSILTYTTSPMQLTDALERLFSPLKALHVPVHEVAMMMSIALRFIPLLVEETDKIMSAQRARGADFDTGNLLQRGKALVPILIPLFVSAFRRADELATAMECRLYQGDKRRTRLRQMTLCPMDGIIACVCAAFFLLVLYLQQTA